MDYDALATRSSASNKRKLGDTGGLPDRKELKRQAMILRPRHYRGWTPVNPPDTPVRAGNEKSIRESSIALVDDPDFQVVSDSESDFDDDEVEESDEEFEAVPKNVRATRRSTSKPSANSGIPSTSSAPAIPQTQADRQSLTQAMGPGHTGRYSVARRTSVLIIHVPGSTPFTFHRMARTVRGVWAEWHWGANGNQPLGPLEAKKGTGWRTSHHPDEAQRLSDIKYRSNYVAQRCLVVKYVEALAKERNITPLAACAMVDEVAQGRMQMVVDSIRKQKDPLLIKKKSATA